MINFLAVRYSKCTICLLYTSNENQLRNFIQKSLDGEYLSVKKKMYFGAIRTDLAERIFNETGVDAENYNITISSNEIRKILLNSHGDEKKKTLEAVSYTHLDVYKRQK